MVEWAHDARPRTRRTTRPSPSTNPRFVPSQPLRNAADREEILAEANTPEAVQADEGFRVFQDRAMPEASLAGLSVTTTEFASEPESKSVKLQVIRPESEVALPGVYYIHGGGITMSSSTGCTGAGASTLPPTASWSSWWISGIASQASSSPEVAPFPAGLNDCVSGLRWVAAHAADLGIDPTRIVVAGESGGGNLTLATGLTLDREGNLGLVKGLYAVCPYIAGQWPAPDCPSSVENEGILLHLQNNAGAMSYGIEAFNERNPLAWPSFAGVDDVTGFPPTVINVNECDPLHDEGINFYRLLLAAGVPARCRQMMGTMRRDGDLLHRLPGHHCGRPPGTSPDSHRG